MATPKKLKLPNLNFYPLAKWIAGSTPLMRDVPEESRRSISSSIRQSGQMGGYVTDNDLGRFCNVNHSSIKRWWTVGVRWEKAEDVCDLVGVHPVEVWPDYYRVLSDAELEYEVERKIDDLVDDKIMEKIGGQ